MRRRATEAGGPFGGEEEGGGEREKRGDTNVLRSSGCPTNPYPNCPNLDGHFLASTLSIQLD